MLIMHPAEIIELFDAGLYGNSRLKNHMVNLWKVTGIPENPHKTPFRTYLEGSASICIFSDLKVNAGVRIGRSIPESHPFSPALQ
jgi:hypothetical protein